MVVICISRNTDFKHHLKLEIGSKYIAKNRYMGGYSIHDLKDKYIGGYHASQFMTLRDYNLNKLLDEN